MRKTITRTYMGAGGVALADILANSVAVVLILIFLSISVKQEQAEQQTEQTVDINILMARKLADSVVLNALPNSRPAYLHDYNSCEIEHDCNPYLFPIIEVYDSYSRIFNTGQVLTRAQLMQPTNELDEYLLGLDNRQLNGIRVDIYGIGMFYLTVATLREYNAPLNHWHFLGENARAPSPGTDTGKKNASLLTQLLERGEAGLAENNAKDEKGTGAVELPDAVDIVDPNAFAGLEEENLLLPPEELNTDSGQETQGGQGKGLLDELLGEFSRQRGTQGEGQQLATSENRRFQLRLPNFQPPSQGEPAKLDLPENIIEQLMITFLLTAISDARTNHKFDPEILGEIFMRLLANLEQLGSYQHAQLVNDIRASLAALQQRAQAELPIEFSSSEEERPTQLQLVPNSAIQKILLSGTAIATGQEHLVNNSTNIDILMRLYPFVHRGDRANVTADTMLIMHPDDFSAKDKKWYPVALVSNNLEQMTLGFVYGTFHAGKLSVPVEVNQVRSQVTMLQSVFSVPAGRFSWQVASAFLLTILLLLLIVVSVVHSRKHHAG